MHMRFHTMEILLKLLLSPAYGRTVCVTSDDYGLFLVYFFYFSFYCKNCTVYVLCMVSVLCSLFSNQLKKIKFCI